MWHPGGAGLPMQLEWDALAKKKKSKTSEKSALDHHFIPTALQLIAQL